MRTKTDSKNAPVKESNTHPHAIWRHLFYTAKNSVERKDIAHRWLEHCVSKHRDSKHWSAEPSTPYDVKMWYEVFRTAAAKDRSAIAIRWMTGYLQYIDEKTIPTTTLHIHIADHGKIMRAMILAIPADSDVLRSEVDYSGRLQVKTASAWMRNFVNLAEPLYGQWAAPGMDSPHMTILRDMWLKRRQADRLAALHKMVTVKNTGNYNLSRRCARSIIWAVAQRNGMREVDVLPAAKLTMLYYKDCRDEQYIEGSTLDIALGVILAKCDDPRIMLLNMTVAQAKEHIIKYPSAAAVLMRDILRLPRFDQDERSVIFGSGGTSVSDGLAVWLPAHKAAFACAEHLGMTQIEVLDQIIQSMQQEESAITLPDVLGEMAP
jgi:hypothetical protein